MNEIDHKIQHVVSPFAGFLLLFFFHLAQVLQSHIIIAYILDFNYTHVSWPSTHFNALFPMNRREIEEQYLHP